MKLISIKNNELPEAAYRELITVLADGGTAVIPTDTSYMLAVDATNPVAVEKLFSIKKRSHDQPVSVCCADIKMVRQFVKVSESASRVADKFLPGPLTLLLPTKISVPSHLIKNGKIGIRVPHYPLTLDIVARYGSPLTATSANVSGGEEPYRISTVLDQLDEVALDLVIDAGDLDPQPVSTIVEFTDEGIHIIREGPITASELQELL